MAAAACLQCRPCFWADVWQELAVSQARRALLKSEGRDEEGGGAASPRLGALQAEALRAQLEAAEERCARLQASADASALKVR
jgi:hypothetical protein